MVVIALAPGLGAALKMLDPNPRKAMDKLERALKRLSKNGEVDVEDGPSGRQYRLTSAGSRRLARLRFAEYALPKKALRKWDGKWRVVCFDIPETGQYVRRLFQTKLSDLGFYRLQNSVFVYPYDIRELIRLANEAFELQKFVRVLTVEQTDVETKLLNFFHLKR